jgi:hypothetical protein
VPWTWIKYAPWGEIARLAARAPDLVRELRRPEQPQRPEAGSQAAPDAPAGLRELQGELDLLRANVDRLRDFNEQQAKALEAEARALAESFAVISRRIRLLTLVSAAALIVGTVALAAALVR